MSTYVLVHGAWHGGWCWHKIVARLEAMGHKVLAPDTQGHGLDRTPPEDTTLAGMVEGTCRVLDGLAEPAILVGHSFGGMVITQAAEERPHKVKELVYLAAFLPPSGKSVLDLSANDADSLLGPEIVFAADGRTVTVNPAALEKCFYASCSDDDIALARSLLVVDGVAPFQAPVTTTAAGWGRIPRTYVECVRDKAIGIGRQREMVKALPCRQVVTLDTDHSPFFSMPDQLAAVLAEL